MRGDPGESFYAGAVRASQRPVNGEAEAWRYDCLAARTAVIRSASSATGPVFSQP